MKVNIDKIITVIILFIILLFSITLLFKKKSEFSPNENRYLQTSSKLTINRLFNKEFISDFENVLIDQIPFRDNLMAIKTSTDKLLGKQDEQGVYFAKNGYLIQNYKMPKNNDKLIKKLNEFSKEHNYINFNLMLVPTSVTINSDLLPNNAITENEINSINYIYNKINFDTIDLYKTFMENKKNYQLFYKLDHHWTSYGAYYAYYQYAMHNSINPIKLSHFDIKEISNNFYGSLYSKTADYSKLPDNIYQFNYGTSNIDVNYVYSNKITNTLYENKYLQKKDQYSYFLDNNHPLIVITNKLQNNNKELLVIKDSYANSIIPFLINHYNKIHIIDPRFYKMSISEYLQDNKNIKDGLILYNINTIDNDTGIYAIR